MKKIIFIFLALSLLAAGCTKVVLQQSVPTSHQASYNELPK